MSGKQERVCWIFSALSLLTCIVSGAVAFALYDKGGFLQAALAAACVLLGISAILLGLAPFAFRDYP